MRVGLHPCFDRFVFQFRGTGRDPGWLVAYESPLTNDGSGELVTPPLRGSAWLLVRFGAWYTGEPVGEPPFSGAKRLVPTGFPALREVRILGGWEGVSSIGLGLDRKRPFLVTWLNDPTRLVVDISTG
jgi:hypothetical protein